MKTAHYDKTSGKIRGWYDKDMHKIIPTPNAEVSDKEWQNAINENANFYDEKTKTFKVKDFSTFKERVGIKILKLKEEYRKANSFDISYVNTTFQADKSSIDTISSILAGGAVPPNFYFLDTLNKKVPMTFKQLQGLNLAIISRKQANFDIYQTNKTLIKNAKTDVKLAKIKGIAWQK